MGAEEVKAAEQYDSIDKGSKRKGGFDACKFIFVFASFENMGFIANMVSLVMYFMSVMHFDIAGASNTLTNLMGTTFLLSVVGGFISDTYLSRLNTCLIFGSLEIMALVLMTVQAGTHHLQPKIGGVKGGIALLFYGSLYLLALGSGGVRGSLPPLGADQFDRHNPKEAKALATFFNLFLLSITVGASVGVTAIVYISTNVGWRWGFFVSTLATFLGFVVLALGKPYYRLRAPGNSPLLSIIQVIVVSIKNRGLLLPENAAELYEIKEKDSSYTNEKLPHTDQFRSLDKAAVLPPNSSDPEPWKVCTVTQVEEVKILTRMLPILASTILMNTCLAQLQTFSVEQGAIMNRKLGKFEFPAPSVPVIPLVFMSILIPVYEYIFVPFARKFTHHPSGITQLQRVGVGLVLSAVSMAAAGLVETKRRNHAHANPNDKISIFWLSFQYGIFGIADMFTLVGLLEFFYREAPSSMKSLATSFTWLTLSFGYFLSTIFVNLINAVTKRVTPSKKEWLRGLDLNSSNLHLFYWFLAILSCLNFLLYLWVAVWYKYKTEEDHPLSSAVETTTFGNKDHDNTQSDQHSRAPMLTNVAPATTSLDQNDQENGKEKEAD
ncbi:Proton-dependent oligopeptide transporter [Trema orientale]|uniref:Proton-dependent oligopeptide transporter n=1 Tax=Trema orientale TaxID=63057 RepID=A0A2P5DRA5_TREOI|nr:Proton-dependent oligopeptide transporter [Trema orientale]